MWLREHGQKALKSAITSCVTLDKLLSFSVLLFSHQYHGKVPQDGAVTLNVAPGAVITRSREFVILLSSAGPWAAEVRENLGPSAP